MSETQRRRGPLYHLGVGLSWGVLALLLIVAAIVIVVPAVSGATPYTILTGSMRPAYPPGTLVVVRPVELADVRLGTVLTYQIESGRPEVVTHRVTEVIQPNLPGGEPRFVTKGDANSATDPEPVRSEQIRGEVWYSVPWIGWVNNVVNGPMRAVIIPVVAGALFVYAGYQVVTSVIARRRGRAAEAEQAADRHDR